MAELDGYAATIDGLPGGPPLAHWRLGEAGGSQITDRKGARHGTYSGTIGYGASGLPQDSDTAVDFGATGAGEVANDAGLQLSPFSLSFWFRLNSLPSTETGALWALISKDQSGLVDGDFAVYVEPDGELIAQFQSASASFQLNLGTIGINATYHVCIRTDGTGFDAYLNGEYKGKNTGFTGAWTSNSQPIRLATVPWSPELADAVLDEVALYSRVLTETEVFELAQRAEAPIATNDTFVVLESQTSVLDVVANDAFVGAKADLTIEVLSQGSHGTATVRGDRDIDFAATAVDVDEADSFTYRITDANGTSNIATADLTVQESASEGGGTLVYSWAPQASWIDGVPLSQRSNTAVIVDNGNDPSPNRWIDGASVGASLVKSARANGTPTGSCCWNRAPTGHPSLEIRSIPDLNSIFDARIQLYLHFNDPGAGMGTRFPRHLRVVVELKTCKASDLTTYKANGIGTTGGSYPDWSNSHSAQGKYFVGMYSGSKSGGGCASNWWNNSSFNRDQYGHRMTWAGSSKHMKTYVYAYGRPTQCGHQTADAVFRVTDPGIAGVWHRIEIECKLADPALANSTWGPSTTTQPTGGDGFARYYCTKDIDGELGPPGVRTLVGNYQDVVFATTGNNRHQVHNLVGPWINLNYGGTARAEIEAWAWIRKIEVYNHD